MLVDEFLTRINRVRRCNAILACNGLPIYADLCADAAQRVTALDDVDRLRADSGAFVDDCLDTLRLAAENFGANRVDAEHASLNIVGKLLAACSVDVVDEVLHLIVAGAEFGLALIIRTELTAHDSGSDFESGPLDRLDSCVGRIDLRLDCLGRVAEFVPCGARHMRDVEIERAVIAARTAVRRVLMQCARAPRAEAA